MTCFSKLTAVCSPTAETAPRQMQTAPKPSAQNRMRFPHSPERNASTRDAVAPYTTRPTPRCSIDSIPSGDPRSSLPAHESLGGASRDEVGVPGDAIDQQDVLAVAVGVADVGAAAAGQRDDLLAE